MNAGVVVVVGRPQILLLLLLLCFPDPSTSQNAICPIGFVWGGLCGIDATCPPSLPPFRCLLGSCCRDQRPLFARLGPIVYPQNLIGGGANLGCRDNALNCPLYLRYCFMSIFRLCMMTHCARTCGFCGFGGLGGLGGGFGLTAGIGGGLGLNGFGGGLTPFGGIG